MNRVTILDWGVGNTFSIRKWLESLELTVDQRELDRATVQDNPGLVVLAGSGNFLAARRSILLHGTHHFLRSWHRSGGKILGICLGMQILFDYSLEGNCDGLGLLGGVVEATGAKQRAGWGHLTSPGDCESPLQEAYYFNHNYGVRLPKTQTGSAELLLEIDRTGFIGLIAAAQICGVQFHPEKSQFGSQEFGRWLLEWLRT